MPCALLMPLCRANDKIDISRVKLDPDGKANHRMMKDEPQLWLM
jgi:hypothetical protein